MRFVQLPRGSNDLLRGIGRPIYLSEYCAQLRAVLGVCPTDHVFILTGRVAESGDQEAVIFIHFSECCEQ